MSNSLLSALEDMGLIEDAEGATPVDNIDTFAEYGEVVTEGWKGAVLGFAGGVLGSFVGGVGHIAVGGAMASEVERKKKEIEKLAKDVERVALDNGKAAMKAGKLSAEDFKKEINVGSKGIIRGVIFSVLFGPFYTAIKGSELEDLISELEDKTKELDHLLQKGEKEGHVTKSGDPKKAAPKPTGSPVTEGMDVATEGWKGAVLGFAGGVLGTFVGGVGQIAVGGALANEVERKKKEIDKLSKEVYKIALDNGEAAMKAGKLSAEDFKKEVKVGADGIVRGVVFGFLFGAIYTAIKGSELEDLMGELETKTKELDHLLKKGEKQGLVTKSGDPKKPAPKPSDKPVTEDMDLTVADNPDTDPDATPEADTEGAVGAEGTEDNTEAALAAAAASEAENTDAPAVGTETNTEVEDASVLPPLEQDPEMEGEFEVGEETAEEITAGAEVEAAVEELLSVVRGIATESFTPAHYALVQSNLAAQTAFLTGNYEAGRKQMPAIESAGTDLRQVALESGEGFIERVRTAIVNGVKRIIEWLKKLFSSIFSRKKTLKQQVEQLEKRAGELKAKFKDADTLTVSGNFLSSDLHLAVLAEYNNGGNSYKFHDIEDLLKLIVATGTVIKANGQGVNALQPLFNEIAGRPSPEKDLTQEEGITTFMKRNLLVPKMVVEKEGDDASEANGMLKSYSNFKYSITKEISPKFAADIAKHKAEYAEINVKVIDGLISALKKLLITYDGLANEVKKVELAFETLVKDVVGAKTVDLGTAGGKFEVSLMLAAVNACTVQVITAAMKYGDTALTSCVDTTTALFKSLEKKAE